MCHRALVLRRCFPIVRPTLSVVRSILYLLQYWRRCPAAVSDQVRLRLTMSSDKGRQERAGAAFSRVLGLRRATIKGVGPERSANKSTRTGVEAGNIRFVKVNGAVAMRKPQVLRK